jgi:hypothetical protein
MTSRTPTRRFLRLSARDQQQKNPNRLDARSQQENLPEKNQPLKMNLITCEECREVADEVALNRAMA